MSPDSCGARETMLQVSQTIPFKQFISNSQHNFFLHTRGLKNTRADASRLLCEAVRQAARGTVRIRSLSFVFVFAFCHPYFSYERSHATIVGDRDAVAAGNPTEQQSKRVSTTHAVSANCCLTLCIRVQWNFKAKNLTTIWLRCCVS
jgi:hypothetical protein